MKQRCYPGLARPCKHMAANSWGEPEPLLQGTTHYFQAEVGCMMWRGEMGWSESPQAPHSEGKGRWPQHGEHRAFVPAAAWV